MVKLQFKFKERTAEAARKRVIDTLGKSGARNVRRLFPDESDEELATLYVMDCQDEPAAQRLLNLLHTSKAVEFAEEEVRRKLVW